jgi:hypothetical protein
VGECAGEVVSPIDFELTAAEREVFEAQIAFESGQIEKAAQTAYGAMLHAAKALVKGQLAPYFRRCRPDRLRIPDALLRHAEILGSLRGRQIRQLSIRRAPERGKAVHGRFDPLPDRRGAAFYRCVSQLQQQTQHACERVNWETSRP